MGDFGVMRSTAFSTTNNKTPTEQISFGRMVFIPPVQRLNEPIYADVGDKNSVFIYKTKL